MILAVNTTKSMLDYRRVYKQQIHQFTANKERDQIYILEAPRCQGTAKIPQFLGSPVSKWILQARKSAVQLTFWGGTPLDFSNRIHVIHIIRHITMWPLLLRPCVIGSILVRMVDLDAGHQKVVG